MSVLLTFPPQPIVLSSRPVGQNITNKYCNRLFFTFLSHLSSKELCVECVVPAPHLSLTKSIKLPMLSGKTPGPLTVSRQDNVQLVMLFP